MRILFIVAGMCIVRNEVLLRVENLDFCPVIRAQRKTFLKKWKIFP